MKRPTHRLLAAFGAVGLAATVLGSAGTAQADPAAFVDYARGTSSTYTVMDGEFTWAQARDAAATVPANFGCVNHLAVITSQAEQDFVTAQLGTGPKAMWLGASKDANGDFQWVTGEPFAFTAWNDGEPNNFGGTEDALEIPVYVSDARWNDVTQYLGNRYLLETECAVPLTRAVVESVTPGSGPATGGTTVTIKGEHFTGAKNVSFGGVRATSYTVVSDTEITAVTPAYAGTVPKKGASVQVRVQTAGSNIKTPTARFRYTRS